MTGTFTPQQQQSFPSEKLKFSMSELPDDWHERIFGKKNELGITKETADFLKEVSDSNGKKFSKEYGNKELEDF